MITFTPSLESVARTLGGSCRGNAATVNCLVHPDTNPSLSLSLGERGAALWHCHAGCSWSDIQAALETRGLIRHDLERPKVEPDGVLERLKEGKTLRLLHPYHDARSNVIGYVARYEDTKGNKSYLPYFNRDASGKWKAGYPAGQCRIIYNLHLVSQNPDATLVIVEGEKCADAFNASSAGQKEYFAIAWPGGASAWNKVDWSVLVNRRVILWPDNDSPGIKAIASIRQALSPSTVVEGVVNPQKIGLGESEDVADFLGRNPAGEQLVAIFDRTNPACAFEAEVSEKLPRPTIKVLSLGEWLTEETPPPDPIIEDCFDVGDKVAIIGSSKTRKSFFTAQLSLCMSTGREFAGLRVPKPRRVLVVQLELKDSHYHRRMTRHLNALGMSRDEVTGGRLLIVNGRGRGVDVHEIQRLACEHRPEVLIIDPLYKILEGDENSAEHFKRTLDAFDRIAEESGAAVMYVHHDKKNVGGETDVRDRGAGSGVLGRDYDCCLALSRHETSEDALVVQPLLRNYAPRKPVCIEWQGHCFVNSRLPALAKSASARGSRKEQLPDSDYEELVLQYLNFAEAPKLSVHKQLTTHGATVQTANRIINDLIAKGRVLITTQEGKRGGVKLLALPPEPPIQTSLTFNTGNCHVES